MAAPASSPTPASAPEFLDAPKQAVGSEHVLTAPEDLIPSGFDGTAGVYNIAQPEQAAQLQRRKVKHVHATRAQIVATANPGCHLQLVNGLHEAGLEIEVVHPVSLLADAYARETKPSLLTYEKR